VRTVNNAPADCNLGETLPIRAFSAHDPVDKARSQIPNGVIAPPYREKLQAQRIQITFTGPLPAS
jgi:hypothetical protein